MMNRQAGESFSLHHGQKRRANDNYESDQRLAKRFNLLDLNRNGKFHVLGSEATSPYPTGRENAEVESMQIDDTKEKVYIYSLDQEIADIESEEEKLVFLPDIEKKLGKIPRSVLTTKSQPVTSNEMILYSVPSSLSVPPDQDNVRKAIIETRARVREKQAQDAEKLQPIVLEAATNFRSSIRSNADLSNHISEPDIDDDENAMDIG